MDMTAGPELFHNKLPRDSVRNADSRPVCDGSSAGRASGSSGGSESGRKQRLSREEAKAQTRQALLEAAAEVFAAGGFNGASIDAVAEAAGDTKGAVYAHFRSKDDLFLALLDQNLSGEPPLPWVSRLEQGESVESMADMIEEQLSQVFAEYRNWSILTLEFLLHAVRNEDVLEKLVGTMEQARQEYVGSLKKHYSAAGTEPPDDLRKPATAFMALENGLSIQALVEPKSIEGGVYTRALKQLLSSQFEVDKRSWSVQTG